MKGWSTKQQLKEQNGMSMGVLWPFFLWREARFYAEMCKWIGTNASSVWDNVPIMYATTEGKITTPTNNIKKE
jgi:hypothetical protein